MQINWSKIDPYLISVEFDSQPENFGDKMWAITADVDVGNKLLLPAAKSFRNRLLRRLPNNASLNGDFLYLVCSPLFKNSLSFDYLGHGYDPRYIHTAYVQEVFNEDDAVEHLRGLIDSMGEVGVKQFTDNIHKFLETDEWDYLSHAED